MGTILATLDGVELITVLTPKKAIPATFAVTAVWLAGAWLAALAIRETRRTLVAAVIAGVIALSLPVAALDRLAEGAAPDLGRRGSPHPRAVARNPKSATWRLLPTP